MLSASIPLNALRPAPRKSNHNASAASAPPGERDRTLVRLNSWNALRAKNQRVDSVASTDCIGCTFPDFAMAFLTHLTKRKAPYSAGEGRLFATRSRPERMRSARHISNRSAQSAVAQFSTPSPYSICPRNSFTSCPGLKRPMRLISHWSRMPEFSSTRARTVSPRYSRS